MDERVWSGWRDRVVTLDGGGGTLEKVPKDVNKPISSNVFFRPPFCRGVVF